MAGRPPLEVGTHGKIRTREISGPDEKPAYRSYCQYRDLDGRTRQVSATGKSIAAAERALEKALKRRGTTTTAEITPETKLRVVAGAWLDTITAAVEAGTRSPSTAREYRSLLDRHVLKAMGDLRLREITTGRADGVLQAIKTNAGEPTAKSCRTVLSGILKHAARHDAVTINVTANTQALSVKPKRAPRALTVDECSEWLAQLAGNEMAVRRDLVDLTGYLLGVGCRIGEALAVAWNGVDLSGRTVAIDYTLVRIKSKGLIRKSTKSVAGERTLPLPGFVTAILHRRALTQFALRAGYLPPADADVMDLVSALGTAPVFPNSQGGWRDPSNTQRDFREARGENFAWVTSHVFRKTALTMLDDAGLPARLISDVAGHSQVSMTQDRYMGRGTVDPRAAKALDGSLGKVFPMHKPCIDLEENKADTA